MNHSLTHRLFTPGAFAQDAVLTVGILMLMALAAIDWALGSDILLHGLYEFPLAGIAYHCQQKRWVRLAFVLTSALQLLVIFSYVDIFLVTKISSALIALTSSFLVLYLAEVARDNYLENMVLATHDSLTGLHNRRSFEEIADAEIARQKRYGGVFSLAIIDLDHFKALNDSQGHQAGDAALVLLSHVLRNSTRESDLIARLGGDEFAVLMPNTAGEDCAHLCQHLAVEIAKHMANSDFPITASIGSITFEQGPESIRIAAQMADKAMYEAKEKGKNCAVCR